MKVNADIKRRAVAVLLGLFVLFSGCVPRYYEDDNSPDGLFNRGQRALEEHRFNEAHYLYGELVKKYPESEYADEALYKKGYLEVYLGKYEDARNSFSALLKKYPESCWRFDASLWDGVLGELSACKTIDDEAGLSVDERKGGELDKKLKILEAENEELREQLRTLRKLLQE